MNGTASSRTNDRGKSQLSIILDGYNFKSYINTIGREELLKSSLGENSGRLNNSLGQISDTLFSLSNSPVYTFNFIKNENFGGVDRIGEFLKVTFEETAESVNTFRDTTVGLGRAPNNLRNIEKNSFRDTLSSQLINNSFRSEALKYNLQGFISNEGEETDFNNKAFSIAKTIKSQTINSNPNEKPTKQNPHLSTYQIFDEALAIGNRQTAELATFLNTIPTLEFSRAVPLIAAKFSLPIKTFKSRSNLGRQFSVANNADFLFGSESESSKSTMSAYRGDTFFKNTSNQNDESVKIEGVKTNLDVFLSPQTMVNTEERYAGADSDFSKQTRNSFGRSNAIIDKMRPFMSIESFDIDVKPTRGLLSYKTAQLNLVLHDRSRMSDIAPFIKPDLFGAFGSEITVEYGWAHPDGSSPYGALLNLMRAKEKYMIVNSNFNLQQTGEVKISLSLAMLGATDILNTDVFGGSDLQNAIRSFKDLRKSFRQSVERFQNTGDTSSIDRLPEFLNDASSILNNSNHGEEYLSSLTSFIGKPNIGQTSIDDILKEKAQALKERLQNISNQKDALLDNFNEVISDTSYDPYLSFEVLRKLNIINNDLEIIDISNTSKNITDYVSFGKVILSLLGQRLAETNRFNEVQILYYNTNSKCSYASSINIANIPIKIDTLKSYISNVIKKELSSFSIGNLVLALSKRFIENKASIIFGFQGIFQYDPKTGTTKVPTSLSVREATAAQKEIIYKAYYGEGKYSDLRNAKKADRNRPLTDNEERALLRKIDFIAPKIGFSTEVVYKSDRVNVNNLTVSPEPSIYLKSSNEDEDTILRLHIFDKSNTPFQGAFDFINDGINSDFTELNNSLILEREDLAQTSTGRNLEVFNRKLSESLRSLNTSVSSNNNQTIVDIGTKFGTVKETYKKIMPSLTYGTQNSAIINASFQTINEGRLSTVFITRADREIETRQRNQEGTVKIGADELPLRVLPSKVDLTTFGCPVINFAQSLFFDFGTGTTIDNLYNVTGIKHSISQGKFESGITLQYGDIYGKFESRIVTEFELENALEKIRTNALNEQREIARERAASRSLRSQRGFSSPSNKNEDIKINFFDL